jgi:hypothetical protein
MIQLSNIKELLSLCPETTNLEIKRNGDKWTHLKIIPKFQNLSSLIFLNFGTNFKSSCLIEMFKLFTNKIEIFSCPHFKLKHEEVSVFYEILFEKTNLVEFKGFHKHWTLEETKIICSWIKKNSTVRTFSMNSFKELNLNFQLMRFIQV